MKQPNNETTMNIEDRPTPDTNHVEGYPDEFDSDALVVLANFARNLERQKAALREALEDTAVSLRHYLSLSGDPDNSHVLREAIETLAETKPKQ